MTRDDLPQPYDDQTDQYAAVTTIVDAHLTPKSAHHLSDATELVAAARLRILGTICEQAYPLAVAVVTTGMKPSRSASSG